MKTINYTGDKKIGDIVKIGRDDYIVGTDKESKLILFERQTMGVF